MERTTNTRENADERDALIVLNTSAICFRCFEPRRAGVSWAAILPSGLHMAFTYRLLKVWNGRGRIKELLQ